MKARKFIDDIQQDEIVAAIRAAEMKTSGEIRVFVSRKPVDDAVAAAQAHFVRMGMEKTRDRNGVLIFVAPRVRKFAIAGDREVHAKCGDSFWRETAAEMSHHFREAQFTRGIVHGIQKAGALLAAHFPRRPDDKNELSDNVGVEG
jgi:uncharacterized membrane protein